MSPSGTHDQSEPRTWDKLSGHVVTLKQGQATTDLDYDSLFEWARQHSERQIGLALYFDGALVPEPSAMVLGHHDRLKANGIYPIYVRWETGLLHSIQALLRQSRAHHNTPAWDGALDLVTERRVRATGGGNLWAALKQAAEAAGNPETGAASQLFRKLASFGKTRAIQLHAVGHSAGCILLAHFVHTALNAKLASFRSVQLLAPALRIDTFDRLLAPSLGGGIEHLTVYALAKRAERADRTSPVYHKSLLYLISHALEHEYNVPLLGLEESLRGDLRTASRLGLAGRTGASANVVWNDSGNHAGFADDEEMGNTVVAEILGRNPLYGPNQDQDGNGHNQPQTQQQKRQETPIAA